MRACPLSMCACLFRMYVCMYIYTCICMYVYECSICMYACVYVWLWLCVLHVHIYIYIYVCVCVSVCVFLKCVCVCVFLVVLCSPESAGAPEQTYTLAGDFWSSDETCTIQTTLAFRCECGVALLICWRMLGWWFLCWLCSAMHSDSHSREAVHLCQRVSSCN